MAASTGSNLQSIDLWSLGRSVSIGTNTGSRRSFGGSSRNWGVGPDNVFARDSESRRQPGDDDEEALKWAALEKLPTYDRLRTTILEQLGNKAAPTQLDVRLAGIEENQALLRNVFNMKSTEEDNEVFLTRLRNRIQRLVFMAEKGQDTSHIHTARLVRTKSGSVSILAALSSVYIA